MRFWIGLPAIMLLLAVVVEVTAYSVTSKIAMSRIRNCCSIENAYSGVGPLYLSKSASSSSTEGETNSLDNPDKKVEGRKKRVIFGYRMSSLFYLNYLVFYLVWRGVQKHSLYHVSGHALALALGYILAGAAQNDRLKSDTYKRLNLSLAEYGLIGLVNYSLSPRFRVWSLAWIPPALAFINSIKGYGYGVLGWDKKSGGGIVADFVEGTKSTLRGFVASPKNVKAAVYLLAAWMVAVMKVAKLVDLFQIIQQGANRATIGGRLARFARLAMLTMILYTLKDAADRDRLEGTTFIELNVMSSVALFAMSAYVGASTPLGGAATVFAAFTAFNGVASIVKKTKKA